MVWVLSVRIKRTSSCIVFRFNNLLSSLPLRVDVIAAVLPLSLSYRTGNAALASPVPVKDEVVFALLLFVAVVVNEEGEEEAGM